jgi:hypothetical protein
MFKMKQTAAVTNSCPTWTLTQATIQQTPRLSITAVNSY